jgi:hypothetical protein
MGDGKRADYPVVGDASGNVFCAVGARGSTSAERAICADTARPALPLGIVVGA